MSRRRSARWAANLLLLVASALLTLLGLEAAVRLFRPQPLASISRSPRLGWIHKPNSEFVYERAEFRVPVRFSSAGLRDREYPFAKPPGTVRIAWLGDSFVEALQVPIDSCAVERLEAALAARPAGPRTEVLNFGVSGYGTCQQLLLLEETVLRFEPDVVIAQYYFNDLDDDVRVGVCGLDAEGALTVAAAESLSASARLAGSVKSFLYRHSHLAMFVATRRPRGARPAGSGSGAAPAATPATPAPTPAAAPATATPSTAPVYDEAGGTPVPTCPGRHKSLEWKLTLRELPPDAERALAQHTATWARMRELCAARGVKFLAVVGVSGTRVVPGAYPKVLHDTGCIADAHDLDLPRQRLAAAAAARGVDVLDLLPAFRAAASGGQPLFFQFDGHWTAAAHRVAAAAVCEALTARGIVQSDRL